MRYFIGLFLFMLSCTNPADPMPWITVGDYYVTQTPETVYQGPGGMWESGSIPKGTTVRVIDVGYVREAVHSIQVTKGGDYLGWIIVM